MVFSFNFASPEEEVEGKGEKRKVEEEENNAVVWRQAKEVLLKDSHLERIGIATFAHHAQLCTIHSRAPCTLTHHAPLHTMHICTLCTLHNFYTMHAIPVIGFSN